MSELALPTVFLMGPTASGKTDLAVRLAEALNIEIISVDSAMVYRGMDIGTAKPGRDVLQKAPHRLIDIRDPAESYSAGDFIRDAKAEIAAIKAAGNIPMLAGGTMMYFHALEYGLAELPPAAPEIRQDLERRAQADGWDALHAELVRIDPASGNRIHPNDPQRIQRALEVFIASGITLSDWIGRQRPPQVAGPLLKFALADIDRSLLHERIERRFQAMMAAGFAEEVAGLRERGDLTPEMASVKAVGYRQLWAALDGEYEMDEGVRRGIVATRRLAKRQYTWLRAQTNTISLDPLESGSRARISALIKHANKFVE
jgi:tRNA dimethylallyltransferase